MSSNAVDTQVDCRNSRVLALSRIQPYRRRSTSEYQVSNVSEASRSRSNGAHEWLSRRNSFEDENASTALQSAAWSEHAEVVQLLLSLGSRHRSTRSFMHRTAPLHWAAWQGHLEVAKILLDHGANPDMQDSVGGTALHFAAQCGQKAMVRALLDHGANMYAKAHSFPVPQRRVQFNPSGSLLVR